MCFISFHMYFHMSFQIITSHALEADLAANLLVLIRHCCCRFFFYSHRVFEEGLPLLAVEPSRLMQCVKSSCIYRKEEWRKTSIAPPTTSSSFLTTTTRFQHLPSGYNSQHTTCSTTIPKFQKNNLESHASYKFVLIHSNRIKQVQKGSSTPSNTFFQKCGKQHTSVVNQRLKLSRSKQSGLSGLI